MGKGLQKFSIEKDEKHEFNDVSNIWRRLNSFMKILTP